MLSYKEHKELVELEEDIGLQLAKELLPKKVLHWLKRVLHKKQYVAVLKLQRDILKRDDGITPHMALIRAAQTYGIKGREIQKVMDKETRYA